MTTNSSEKALKTMSLFTILFGLMSCDNSNTSFKSNGQKLALRTNEVNESGTTQPAPSVIDQDSATPSPLEVNPAPASLNPVAEQKPIDSLNNSPSSEMTDVEPTEVEPTEVAVAQPSANTPDVPPSIPCEKIPADLPSTCDEYKGIYNTTTDGPARLFVGGDPTKSWNAYCFNMTGKALEYLTLVNTAANQNFSQYAAGGASPGTTVTTRYTKVRIDPVTMEIQGGDQRFATSSGSLLHSSTTKPINAPKVVSMPFGAAMSCSPGIYGRANINLAGTPFTVEGNFKAGGFSASGGGKILDKIGQIIDATGAGYCGWSTVNWLYFPHNTGNTKIKLQFKATPDANQSCDGQ